MHNSLAWLALLRAALPACLAGSSLALPAGLPACQTVHQVGKLAGWLAGKQANTALPQERDRRRRRKYEQHFHHLSGRSGASLVSLRQTNEVKFEHRFPLKGSLQDICSLFWTNRSHPFCFHFFFSTFPLLLVFGLFIFRTPRPLSATVRYSQSAQSEMWPRIPHLSRAIICLAFGETIVNAGSLLIEISTVETEFFPRLSSTPLIPSYPLPPLFPGIELTHTRTGQLHHLKTGNTEHT